MPSQHNNVFQRPVAEVIRLSADDIVRAEYEAREKAIRDRIAERARIGERQRGRLWGKLSGDQHNVH